MDVNKNEEFARHVANPEPHSEFFYGVTIVWGIIILLVTFLLAFFGNEVKLAESNAMPTWQIFLGLAILWLAFSVKRIGPDEQGAILLWGKTMIAVRRGPKVVIAGIFQLERFGASVRNRQFPDDPEFIQKTDDKIPLEQVEITLPDGTKKIRNKVRPIRLTTAKPVPGQDDDILNVQMVVEFTFWVRYIVVNPFLYIVNAQGFDDASRAAAVEGQMRDTGETALTLEVTKLTPSQLISQMEDLQVKLESALKAKIVRWGVEIVDLGLTSPDLSHELSSALRDIPKEKANAAKALAIAAQVRTQADAESYRLTKEGEGLGNKREAELAGEGRGYKKMAEILNIEGREALAAQVARDTVGEGDLIVGMDGVRDVIAMGKMVLGNNKSEKENKG